jgi:hypothetical protein
VLNGKGVGLNSDVPGSNLGKPADLAEVFVCLEPLKVNSEHIT